MTIKDLLPWKQGEKVPIQRQEEEGSSLPAIRREMNRLFDDFFASPFGLSSFGRWSETMSPFTPNIDVTETDDEITITAELPGMDEKDIEILLDRDALVISGEKRSKVEEKNRRYYRLECSYGSFRRSIPLPREVDQEKAEARFKKGVLSITLPKTESDRDRIKHVKVKSN